MYFKRISLDEIREIENRNGKPMTFASKDLKVVGVTKYAAINSDHYMRTSSMIKLQSSVLCLEETESKRYIFIDFLRKELIIGSGIKFLIPDCQHGVELYENIHLEKRHDLVVAGARNNLQKASAMHDAFFKEELIHEYPREQLDNNREVYLPVISNLSADIINEIASEFDKHDYPPILRQLRNFGGRRYYWSDHSNSSNRDYYIEKDIKPDEILPNVLSVDQLFDVAKGFRDCIGLKFHYEKQDKQARDEEFRRKAIENREYAEKRAAEKKRHLLTTEPTFAALDALTAGT